VLVGHLSHAHQRQQPFFGLSLVLEGQSPQRR
jgi:hypothetical protein